MLIKQPTYPTCSYLPRIHENICSHKDLNMNVYNSFIHNRQNLEIMQTSANREMEKNYSNHRIKYHSAMKRSKLKLYQEKEADRKCYILCDSIYMMLWKK